MILSWRRRTDESTICEPVNKLSDSERQRLSIARAVLKVLLILIRDEATSSLDAKYADLVQDELESLMVGRTSLSVAHRLSTIRKADRIVVLGDGHIVEEGSHHELLERRGEYSKLYTIQLTDLCEEMGQKEIVH